MDRWPELLPNVAMLVVVAWFIHAHRSQPVLQIHTLIVTSYLTVFPALDFLFSEGGGMDGFGELQLLLIIFFQVPLMLFSHHVAGPPTRRPEPMAHSMRLHAGLPVVLGILLLNFWFVALNYDLFFRRLGHEGLQRNAAEVPTLLLYGYRGAVETAFFVIAFLWTTLRRAAPETHHYRRYKWALAGYLLTFILFFAANSRMQFVLLLLCLICTQPVIARFVLKPSNLLTFGLGLMLLVLGLTLFREFLLEHNDRITSDDLPALIMAAGWLIASRLDSVVILHSLREMGFDPWGFDLSGVVHVLMFYISFFADSEAYNAVKESLVTSPSVLIVNRLLSASEVDFPKSMILDMFLSFGALGLLLTACLLGLAVGQIQRSIASSHNFQLPFLAALYMLPMLLEFEKEFIGLFFSMLKWAPALVLVYLWRPHQGLGLPRSQTLTQNRVQTLSNARPR